MQILLAILLLLCGLVPFSSVAQFNHRLDSLCRLCVNSKTDSQKVIALGQLANYYYVYKLDKKADSVLQEQLRVAEFSNNNNLVLNALFGDAILNIGSSATSESFDNTISFIQKGIDFARSAGRYDYQALGYSRLADIQRRRGQLNQALSSSVAALSMLANVASDSVKAIIYTGLGDTYLQRSEVVSACNSYNSAYDLAVKLNSAPLQSLVHHSISEMYKKLGDDASAKEELTTSMQLNKQAGNSVGLLMDYYDLARLTDEKYYIDKAVALADSLDDFKFLLNAKRLLLAFYYVKEKDQQKALDFLNNEPDLKMSFLNNSSANFNQVKGNIYFYTGSPDSALHYYRLAEPQMASRYDVNAYKILFSQIGDSYSLTNNYLMAITYYLRSLNLSQQLMDANSSQEVLKKLSDLYAKTGDFKKAFEFASLSDNYKDSLKALSKENQIALLRVERENKKHQQDLLVLQKMENSRRNLQYMAITVAIIMVFFIILIVGSFPVSRLTVKLMGYFFFISLFEFIVLLIDNLFLNHATHNEPLKLWVIKIALIGLLVPFQHFLETNLIRLLQSRKLLEARRKFRFQTWLAKMKKPAPINDETLDQDAAVL